MPELTDDQIRLFARQGFLHLERVLDPTLCDVAVEDAWNRLPPRFDRRDPSTWRGEVTDSCMTAGVCVRAGLVKFQQEVRNEPFLDGLLPHRAIGDLARQLIHTDAEMVPLVRGIYLVLPIPRLLCFAHQGHIEVHPFQLGTIGYLQDVDQDGGAFSVWPGSHREMYHAFDSKLGYVANARFRQLYAHYNRIEPLRLPGRKGDLIVFHHRLFHAPSNNTTRRIRFALLTDYHTPDTRAQCHQHPGELWEHWPGVNRALAKRPASRAEFAQVLRPLHQRTWFLRNVVHRLLSTADSRARTELSRRARSQTSVKNWKGTI